jgi:hypothetical protein
VKPTENPYQNGHKKSPEAMKKDEASKNQVSLPNIAQTKKNNLIGGTQGSSANVITGGPNTRAGGLDDAHDLHNEHERHEQESQNAHGSLQNSRDNLSASQQHQKSGKVPIRKTFKPNKDQEFEDM